MSDSDGCAGIVAGEGLPSRIAMTRARIVFSCDCEAISDAVVVELGKLMVLMFKKVGGLHRFLTLSTGGSNNLQAKSKKAIIVDPRRLFDA